eukprot:138641-Prorocentrum_minimum.AAC.1
MATRANLFGAAAVTGFPGKTKTAVRGVKRKSAIAGGKGDGRDAEEEGGEGATGLGTGTHARNER